MPQVTTDIPNSEGFARVRILANSTQIEIGCFQIVKSNGKTFAQADSVGSTVGIVIIAAMLSSFVTSGKKQGSRNSRDGQRTGLASS